MIHSQPISLVLPTHYGPMIVHRLDINQTTSLLRTGRAMDHSTISLTMDRYTHQNAQIQVDALSVLPDLETKREPEKRAQVLDLRAAVGAATAAQNEIGRAHV